MTLQKITRILKAPIVIVGIILAFYLLILVLIWAVAFLDYMGHKANIWLCKQKGGDYKQVEKNNAIYWNCLINK